MHISLFYLLLFASIIHCKNPEFYGDIRGNANHTIVVQVGGQTASNVAQAVKLVGSGGSSADVPNTLVGRDANGNFATNMITLDGTTTNATDAATKAYVDSTVSTGVDGANIGSGAGQVFKDKTGADLNFRTIGVGNYLTIDTDTTTANTITVVTNATDEIVANTIVARDGSGEFKANLFGDVIGDISNTEVATVGSATASQVSDTVLRVASASSTGTPSSLLALDSFGNFAATTLTGNVTGNVTGSASSNVLKTGDTMTGQLGLPAGTAANPAVNYASDGTIMGSGIYFPTSHSLSLSTKGSERLNIGSTGVVSINSFSGSPGVVHNNSAGGLTSSAIVNADVAAGAGIVDTKLATILTAGKVLNSATTATSDNTANAIVARDASNNFSAGTITASLTGNVTGNVTGNASGSAGSFTGNLVGDVTGTQGATVVSTVGGVTASNVASGATAANNATSANTANTIVMRDNSGEFHIGGIFANGIDASGISGTYISALAGFTGNLTGDVTGNVTGDLTGSVTGAASLNVLKAGDTMTGPLAMPAGSAASPSLQYSADGTVTGTGVYFPGTHSISLSTNGSECLNINSSGTVKIDGFAGANGVVHNDSSGNLTSSAIVNADVDANAGIVDTKLATITTAGKVANSATTATNLNTASKIVARDASGNFNAGTIGATTVVLSGLLANQGLQTVVPIDVVETITVGAGIGILLLTPAITINANQTIVFPASPINGQFFTIILGSSNPVNNIINSTSPNALVNGVTALSTAVPFVTYYYNNTTWYRCG